jgi:CBS-domain-containing membrane protein
MVTATHPLLCLTAADLMTRDVVTVSQKLSLQAAAHCLAQARISGAPVVDDRGRCVGILSAIDFLYRASSEDPGIHPACGHPSCYGVDWQSTSIEELPAEEVAAHMTRDLITATPRTGINTLARMMLDAHIHRIVILDEQQRPIGIVSSTDILAAVAHAEQMLAGDWSPTEEGLS